MPQYFTNGWMVGATGDDELSVAYPVEWEDVDVTLTPRDPASVIALSWTKFERTHDEVVMSRSVVIHWINATDDSIPFDYEITERH